MEVLHGIRAEGSDQAKRSVKNKKVRRRKRMLTGVSRQRRAANTRERQRVHGVNLAFQDLRRLLPVLSEVEVSKIDILRLAAKWIAHLTAILLQDDQEQQQSSMRADTGDRFAVVSRVCGELATDFIICRTEDPVPLGAGIARLRSLASGEGSRENSCVPRCRQQADGAWNLDFCRAPYFREFRIKAFKLVNFEHLR
eukprot:g47199.t1